MTDEAKRIVEALRFEEDFECIDCPIPKGNCKENCLFDDAADLIESLSAQLDQVTRERDAAESNKFQYETGFVKAFEAAQPKWISVEERLPEVDMGVVCVAQTAWGPEVTEGYFWKQSQMISPIDEACAFDKVTHWMPLPEPPKEDA